ncbi:hypothetical protein LOZ58_001577 [Ophidiomyces ophidiicola]|nr:hypothetical protein LOZ58_001577 [Ophidiomyces ophidiicola]
MSPKVKKLKSSISSALVPLPSDSQVDSPVCLSGSGSMEIDDIYTLSAGLKRYLASGKFADFTIRVAGEEFKAHRVIVCSQSEFFTKLYDNEWKETAENKIDIEDAEPDVVEAMISFMYNGDYDSSGGAFGRTSSLFLTARVYRLAEKLGVPRLKEKTEQKFEDAARTCWNMDDFTPVIQEVYATTSQTDRGLRNLIVKICIMNLASLLKKEEFVSVLEDCAPFSADIAQMLAKNSTVLRDKYQCPSCGNQFEAIIPTLQGYCLHCGYNCSNWNSYKVN